MWRSLASVDKMLSLLWSCLRFPSSPSRRKLPKCHRKRKGLLVKQKAYMALSPGLVSEVSCSILVNRSLLSFLICCEMDFLWLTETWLQVAESSSISKLLPSDCSYFNFPRTTNRGGGEVTVCKSSINCQQLLLLSNFELSMLELRFWAVKLASKSRAQLVFIPPVFPCRTCQGFHPFFQRDHCFFSVTRLFCKSAQENEISIF